MMEAFGYEYMLNAILGSAMVGGVCAFLSCYLMLKGWSLISDALSHAMLSGVSGASMLGLPLSLGAFISAGFAAGCMLFLKQRTKLKVDVIIELIFSFFFGGGLFIISLNPALSNIHTVIFGNVLDILPSYLIQLFIIASITIVILVFKWKDLMLVFFDESHAKSVGLRTEMLNVIFFVLLTASIVAAIQTVGLFMVLCLVVTPGAAARMLTNSFPRQIIISVSIGSVTSFLGAWSSYYFDNAPGCIIVMFQIVLFMCIFLLSPTHGLIANSRRIRQSQDA
ncbi:TPA: metal ABC transporter permease [Enterobacter ludwigii]